MSAPIGVTVRTLELPGAPEYGTVVSWFWVGLSGQAPGSVRVGNGCRPPELGRRG
jgi:hypothetical protein